MRLMGEPPPLGVVRYPAHGPKSTLRRAPFIHLPAKYSSQYHPASFR